MTKNVSTTTTYGEKVLSVEPFGIEAIPASERHGRVGQIFTFWFSANLNILTWFTGALGIILGLSFPATVGAIMIGNILGTLFLAVVSAQGPKHGLPQIAASGKVYGPIGLKLFGSLNWLGNVGWFAVDIILGVIALEQVFGVSYLTGLLLLGALTIVVAVIGYNFIHRFAQIMAVALGAFFLVMSIRMIPQISPETLWAPSKLSMVEQLPIFVLAAAAVFSYQLAFCTCGSDYSRYLRTSISSGKIARYTFFGSILAGAWLEILGAAVTSLNPQGDSIALIAQLMGPLAIPALLTIALSTIPINVLATYSGGISLMAAGIPLKRWISPILTGGLGILLVSSGSGAFADTYKNFLLLLSYWITPWLGILLVTKPFSDAPVKLSHNKAVVLYFLALLLSVPFMSSTLYTGYIAHNYLEGADISYIVGLLAIVLGVQIIKRPQAKVSKTTLETT
ncbi:MAG: cytosine permease [Desulfosporosinus sp.]|nr:cytosine permease [Desulfosporosinus sp.]